MIYNLEWSKYTASNNLSFQQTFMQIDKYTCRKNCILIKEKVQITP
jgi:hypothetical protein